MDLASRIEELYTRPGGECTEESLRAFEELKAALNEGRVRAAEPTASGWKVNVWVKKGILLGFRVGRVVEMPLGGLQFRDKHTMKLKQIPADHNARIVPGGTAIRDGSYLGRDVICMPPAYVNIGAYVDDGTMIDSHALVGSCAQVGKRVHLSAGAQIGGVLEPAGSLPVIIEDDVLVGGNCGIYEGAIVGRGAVLAPGVILTGATPVYDLVRQRRYARQSDQSLQIPAGAVVVPGSRAISQDWAREQGLALYAPMIVKYRDAKTDAAIRLEDFLR